MTKDEKKILTHLYKRYPDPNATDVDLLKYLKLEKTQFNIAIKNLEANKYIREISSENQKFENLKSWEITVEGAITYNNFGDKRLFGKYESWTAWAIILGGFISAIYYFIEILKNLGYLNNK